MSWSAMALRVVVCIALSACAFSCQAPQQDAEDATPEPSRVVFERLATSPAPADLGTLCADVGGVRVCWGEGLQGEGCDGDLCVHARPLPSGPPPRAGWRCFGLHVIRACAPRGDRDAIFVCDGDACQQAYPRMPDDGEWECAERSGVVVCRRGIVASGVVPGTPDPAWICGERPSGEPICVDLSPDMPQGATTGWRCHYQHGDSVQRLCERAADEALVGAPCGEGCPDGARCVENVCVPPKPQPTCWQDTDCDEAKACRFGSCVSADAS